MSNVSLFQIFLFHTHCTTKYNKFILTYNLAWVGIVERFSGNPERKEKAFERRKIFRFQTFDRKDECKTKHKFVLDTPNLLFKLLWFPAKKNQHIYFSQYKKKTSLLCRLQAQTRPDATPQIGKIQSCRQISVTLEPVMQLWWPLRLRIS